MRFLPRGGEEGVNDQVGNCEDNPIVEVKQTAN